MLLDRLCLMGEVVWGRPTPPTNGDSPTARNALSRNTPVTLALRDSLDWLLDHAGQNGQHLSGAAEEVLELLTRRGASFMSGIVTSTRRLPSDVEEALWQLAAAGRVTADTLEPLRQHIMGNPTKGRRATRLKKARARRGAGYSRWSLFQGMDPTEDSVESKARQLLRRYGVLFPELLGREPMAPRWRDLVRVLRRLEARGEIRGGRFVAGFVGEQFALPETVETIRALRNAEPDDQWLVVSACDPLNVVGFLTPGERVPAVLGNRVAFRNGVPICSLEGGEVVVRAAVDEAILAEGRALLQGQAPASRQPVAVRG